MYYSEQWPHRLIQKGEVTREVALSQSKAVRKAIFGNQWRCQALNLEAVCSMGGFQVVASSEMGSSQGLLVPRSKKRDLRRQFQIYLRIEDVVLDQVPEWTQGLQGLGRDQRFIACHEIGHSFWFDRSKYCPVDLRVENGAFPLNKHEWTASEYFCDAFAAMLLFALPTMVVRGWETLQEVRSLSERFRVPEGVVIWSQFGFSRRYWELHRNCPLHISTHPGG